ncbi:uncharacterized protein TrAtP1_006685 [Trichoderma atroviride]|uniref:uncharacterized protein n=1 Tax=Hypocrea atroviridis TaxID=63577 RepID=UPI00333292D6|nr:hypothetical protein TrAtP1_006685 [Trichoderma atroviride]
MQSSGSRRSRESQLVDRLAGDGTDLQGSLRQCRVLDNEQKATASSARDKVPPQSLPTDSPSRISLD